ncbi:MAG: hypothetical protein LBL07_13035 [Tannerella sp.]|jgi:hypothetical protein|nr:hypothetical protein [Tannerella sp.]
MNVVNTDFIKFRLRRFVSAVKDIPPLYMVIIVILLAAGGFALFAFTDTEKGGLIAGGCWVFILLYIHFRRKDYHFVYLVEERPWRVFAVDYLLLSLPILLMEILQGFLPIALAIVAGCVLVGRIRQPHIRARHFPVPRLIPVEAFEIRAGFRRYGGLFSVFYVIAYAALWLPYVSFAALWFCVLFLSDFLKDCEPVALLCSRELAVRRFLRRKLFVNLRLLALSTAPVCLVYALIHPGGWWLACGFFILLLCNAALFILIKYAYYRPGGKVTAGQIPIIFSALGMLIPVLAPFTAACLLRYYPLAIRNLTPWLYAYH